MSGRKQPTAVPVVAGVNYIDNQLTDGFFDDAYKEFGVRLDEIRGKEDINGISIRLGLFNGLKTFLTYCSWLVLAVKHDYEAEVVIKEAALKCCYLYQIMEELELGIITRPDQRKKNKKYILLDKRDPDSNRELTFISCFYMGDYLVRYHVYFARI